MLRIASEFEDKGFKLRWFNNDDDNLPSETSKPVL
jgi:hypothetical protein